jgi:hypothetical protein
MTGRGIGHGKSVTCPSDDKVTCWRDGQGEVTVETTTGIGMNCHRVGVDFTLKEE